MAVILGRGRAEIAYRTEYLIHGAGGNAAAMWPCAAHLSTLGAPVTTVDLPGYGRTRRLAHGDRGVRYPALNACWSIWCPPSRRPSADRGGCQHGALAVDKAAVSGRASRVIATCLLDPTRPGVPAAIIRAPWMVRLGRALLPLATGPLADLPIPVRLLTPMAAIANDPRVSREVLTDPHGGDGSMPLGWYRSFLDAGPASHPRPMPVRRLSCSTRGRTTGPTSPSAWTTWIPWRARPDR
ncbi:alpha/beta hydrolase [Granulicoccus phenolivorans]|uniref:alpha/beta hydrolase n=1 Tax=Granulicoccus phenolivorans TaxID=266854 RepID=UPI0004798A83|nr:alpha/beta hydrolase [Granulicoccus phenolivorans]